MFTSTQYIKNSTRKCLSILGPPAAAHLAPNTRRSSNFSLVGSHKITLASLGHSKFPLDKVLVSVVTVGREYLHWHLE